jgi:hypothetical protein
MRTDTAGDLIITGVPMLYGHPLILVQVNDAFPGTVWDSIVPKERRNRMYAMPGLQVPWTLAEIKKWCDSRGYGLTKTSSPTSKGWGLNG